MVGREAPVLICHSHLRWDWVFQRPQHLLSRLAREWTVIVEEEPVFDDRPAGLDVLDVGGGVTVLRPHRRADVDHDLGRLVEGYVAMARGRRPLVRWFYSPMFAAYGDRLGPGQVVVYDCMDELAGFAGAPAGLKEAEDRLLERADVVFTGGRALYEAKRDRNPGVHCFPSAVEETHFARALDPDLPLPADLAGLPRPILGYYGVVDERLDYDLIAALADDRPEGSVVLVGPTIKVDPARLPRRPNLRYLGQKGYAELPAYLKGFDVCLMPWALNEATRHISPTKTLEYMAGGKPIVSTAVQDVVRDHGDIVLVARDAAHFLGLARQAPALFDADREEAGRRRAKGMGWDGTADAMRRLVEGKLGEGRRRPRAARPPQSTRSLIVGGGPAGLSAGLHLDDSDFILADRHDRAGGLCRSIVQDGFTFDYAGHIFFTNDPYVDGLFRGILADNFHEQQRESWIHLYDSYQRYPFQGNLYGLPPEVIKECLLGVIKAGRDADAPAGNANGGRPLNFLEWSLRTFGEGITKHFMQPYNFKVWGIDPARMSSDWIAGRVLTPSLDEVIDGSLRRGRGDMGPNARFGYPLRGGCEMFVSGLARRVEARGGEFAMRRSLVSIDPARKRATFRVGGRGEGGELRTIRYDRLFPSVPLPELIEAIDGAPESVRKAAAGLPSTAVVCVNLGIDREKVTEKHWIYYPEGQDKFLFQRIFVQSNASPHTAPPGHSALTFEISHSKYKPLPVKGKRAMVEACVAGLKRTDLWREGDQVAFEQVLGMPHAYIPFTPDREGRLAVINAYLHKLDIYPIGRFGEWKYVNQDGAILSGKRVVESVQADGKLQPEAAAPAPAEASPPQKRPLAVAMSAEILGNGHGNGHANGNGKGPARLAADL
ncbi:Putative teichuronic acid biosynthesis glycosyltransferase TuaH [Aquisphaera giovannonii]|uniref:Teichuronic acid biosynthesis glycosyltransferase TuaH n=2 Tax=Aquisphaera giovannonii TaxID=406548 RepID=A0A5B9W5P0_9BACT|nr:Putative teichuronic acid biosynthesis glycosyltransferase TuaH [Aquisphaera giovannonii]